jgi:phosphopantetheinyl transferase
VSRWLLVRDEYDIAYFTEDELATANAFRLEKRRDEWLLARYAAKKLAMELGIVEDPRACGVARPMLLVDGAPVSWFVSISHSAPYAAAAIGREPVGIDVQVVRDVPERGAHLFLSEAETAAMQSCTLADRLLHFWCAKEAAWKPRSDEFTTLRQLPLELREERATGLRFDLSTTRRLDDLILALTLPTS